MGDTKPAVDEAASEQARAKAGRVRIEDVAEAAGVSMKTVSRVLNNEPNVSPRTRTLVEAAVEKLRYRPLPSARVLAGRRSYLVAMLFDNPSSNYLMEIELGVLDACQAQHYNLMLAPLVYNADDIIGKVEALVVQAQLDGVILTPPITDDVALLRRLEDLGIPYASISAKEQNRHVGVVVDEHGAVCAMMAHLASLGHRRIGHVRGHAAHGASAWRLAGYREGLRRAGLRYDAKLVEMANFHTSPATPRPTPCSTWRIGRPRSSPPTTTWPPVRSARSASVACRCPVIFRSAASTTRPSRTRSIRR